MRVALVSLVLFGSCAMLPVCAHAASEPDQPGAPADHAAAQTRPAEPTRLAQAGQGQAATSSASGSPITEITVTATRQAQSISKVPISVTAFSQQQMDDRGIKTFADIVNMTPGINLTPVGNGTTVLSIRGMASTAGAATTGVYIDDTPIQVRSIGYAPVNTYPELFDIDRVEVLRGPQGTLFGSGSEGGTVRFIQPDPSLTNVEIYSRAEVSDIDNGGLGYEGGAAVSAPIVDGVLGFRVSAFFRKDGGWIDSATGTAVALDPSGSAGPASVGLEDETIAEHNINYADTTVLRAALKWQPTDNLTVSPSITYQDRYENYAIATFWPELSNYSSGSFVTYQPTPVVDATHVPISVPVGQPQDDVFTLSALNIDWHFGSVDLISNTSYFQRGMNEYFNAFEIEDLAEAGYLTPGDGDLSDANYINKQHNITQEVRLRPASTGGPFDWTVGLFFQRAAQLAQEGVYSNFIGYTTDYYGLTPGSQPFGPGSSAYVDYWGEEPLNGTETWFGHFLSIDRQYALYAQTDYAITSAFKATVGVRLARDQNYFEANYAGPENNLDAPLGQPCTTAGGCIPGQGIYAIKYQSGTSTANETAVTPKVGLSYEPNDNSLYYVSATEGFRPGGGQIGLSEFCASGLKTLGYTNGQSPENYGSDSVWSYEVGSKDKLFDGLLQLSGSAYLLKWKNIQSEVIVDTCFQGFTSNLGSATGKGVDLDLKAAPLPQLQLGVLASYSVLSFDERVAPGGATVYSAGSAVPDSGAPLHVDGSVDSQFRLSGEMKGYLHTDSIYNNAQRRTGATDPDSVDYVAGVEPVPAWFEQNVRVGVRWGGYDVSLFVNNLTNSFPHLALSRGAGTIVWSDMTLQPRTVGLTVAYRY